MSSASLPSTLPSASPSSPSASHSAAWHFPFGPSTKYHQRERPTGHHTRNKSAYTPIAPVLSTEKRAAHRRTLTQTQRSCVSTASSPPSEYTRSPLSRFSSYSASFVSMPGHNSRNHNSAAMPTTPAKGHRRRSSLQNSPFSDYFTDDARSVDTNVPSTETKQLLVRMNKLQSQLMRDQSETGREALRIVGDKLDEIERDYGLLYSHSRAPFPIEDSGIFSDEDESDVKKQLPSSHTAQSGFLDSVSGSLELPPEPVNMEQYKAERDWFILRMQELLDGLRFTQAELGRRFGEVRNLNEQYNAQIEERETQLEQLRSENEGLRSDLGFEYSELLFLKLQMKALEVDMNAISENLDVPDAASNRGQSVKKNEILSEMDRWRADWQDVEGRFKRRRSKYGVSTERRFSASPENDAARQDGEVEWQLQTVKEGQGRVTSLTIKRMDSSYGAEQSEDTPTAPLSKKYSLDGANTSMNGAHKPSLNGTADDIFTSLELANSQHLLPESLEEPTTIQGADEPQIAQSKYKHNGTQTEPPPTSPNKEDDDDDDNYDTDSLFSLTKANTDNTSPEYDCAITTSSELSSINGDEDEDQEDEHQQQQTPPPTTLHDEHSEPRISAWQELWDSLQNLSGLGDDRF